MGDASQPDVDILGNKREEMMEYFNEKSNSLVILLSVQFNDPSITPNIVKTLLKLVSGEVGGLDSFAETMTEIYGEDDPIDV
jgi:hypothetical protein